MGDIHLTMASYDYDHVRDLGSGLVKPQGIELTCLNMQVEEIFYRFTNALEWDISEMSFAKYCSIMSQDDPPITGIPVFISRVFRHSAFYIKRQGKIASPLDLAGGRIGIPEWSQTATVYARGWLTHQIGIPLTDIEWIQAGVNEPGRKEMAHLKLPDGVRYSQEPGRSLTDMLLAGDIDAMISANPPQAFRDGHPEMARLMPDYRTEEAKYFRETGIYPIMHTVAIRRDVFERHPWVAMNLLNAFEEAKRRSIHRLSNVTASQIPMPWIYDSFEKVKDELFDGGEYWPYGIEPNRTTIEAFLQYCYEQGVCHRLLTPEELYPREVQSEFKI
jgi:4,5-dihydroxyphthalate decarboxylase